MILRDAVNTLDTGAAWMFYPSDPFACVLYENAGYLIDDARREHLYERLRAHAPDAHALLATDRSALLPIAYDGGLHPETRIERWYEIARITLEHGGDDLAAMLRGLDAPKRRALLGRYPTIGDPEADKIVLFCTIAPEPSADSNVLRVLERLKLIPEVTYPEQYRLARELHRASYGNDAAALRRAYNVLRTHGLTVCRRSIPSRDHCPLIAVCGTA